MTKLIRYLLLLAIIGLLGYNSVYFKKLSEVNKTKSSTFDATAYARQLWQQQLPARMDSAVDLHDFINAISANSEQAFARYSHALAIGNERYSLVSLTGTVYDVGEDETTLIMRHGDTSMSVALATEFIYGNAIRDASGLVDIKNFTSTSDLNNVSEALNKLARTTVIAPFKKQVKRGDTVQVVGAIAFNKAHINVAGLELIPIRLKIISSHAGG